MEFVHIDQHNKRVEEEALFDLAGMIWPENAGLLPDPEGFTKFVEPLLTGRRVHAETTANFVAFAILGSLLKPTTGSWRFFPQCAPEWLAFRRLFLEICDLEIPENLRRSPIQSMAEADPLFYSKFCEEHGLAIEPRLERGSPSSAEREAPADEQAVLRKVVAVRLANYEGVSLKQMKDDFVNKGQTSADSECGALYELKQNIPWELFPESLDFETVTTESSTAGRLCRFAKEAGSSLDFADAYRAAVLSVRGVLFDLSVEHTFGRLFSTETPIRELENAHCMRLLVRDSMSIESDEKVRSFLVDGLAGFRTRPAASGREGAAFARSIAAAIDAAQNKVELSHHENVKKIVTVFWLNPDFPLWFMTVPAIESFLRLLGITRPKPGLGNAIRELTKNRTEGEKSHLVGIGRGLITAVDFEVGDATFGRVVFTLQKNLKATSPVLADLPAPTEWKEEWGE